MREITAKSLAFDLLRAVRPEALPISALVAAAGLFGISGNALRVAVTRLAARGLLESDEPGSYRLGKAGDPLAQHVDEWRRGEARRRAWCGGWLMVHLPRGLERNARRHSERALQRLGFREGLDGVHVRPDNLALDAIALTQRLRSLGLVDAAQLFEARPADTALSETWSATLWPLAELGASYQRALAQLEQSLHRLPQLSLSQAVAETFQLGGEAIGVLATDPLLPDELLCGAARRDLTEAMLHYEHVGRGYWGELSRRAQTAPAALEAGACA